MTHIFPFYIYYSLSFPWYSFVNSVDVLLE